MLINWFTVGAQVLNFIVLVWLLKRFLYKPVLNAIDAREKRVAAESANAELQMTEVRKSRDELQTKGNAFDEQRGALLAKAILDAKTEAERLLANARQAAGASTLQRNAALQSATARLNDELSRLAAAESINILREPTWRRAYARSLYAVCEGLILRLKRLSAFCSKARPSSRW
jgi:F-type H+-transporting ATPase subunit b